MEEHGVPPSRPDIVRALWRRCSAHVMVPDMAALHALPETLGTTAVSWPAPFQFAITGTHNQPASYESSLWFPSTPSFRSYPTYFTHTQFTSQSYGTATKHSPLQAFSLSSALI